MSINSETSSAATSSRAPAAAAHERLSYKTLLSYGSIRFATQAVFTINGVHLLFFYVDTVELDGALVGLVLFWGHMLDAITNPLMGMLSDATRTKSGRRRPYYIPGCTLTAIAWVLLYSPPERFTGNPLFLYMLVMYLIYNCARTMFYIPWSAHAPDLTENYDERSRLAAYTFFMGIPGDVIGGIFPIFLGRVLNSQRQGFLIATSVIGTLLVLASVWCRWGTYERAAPPRPRRDPETAPDRVKRGVRYIREALRSIWTLPTAVILTATLLATIGGTVPIATFRFVTKYYFHAPQMDEAIILIYNAASICSIPGWLYVARRFQKKHAYLGALLGWLACALPITACGPDDVNLYLVSMVGIGVCGTGLGLLAMAMSPDVVGWNRLHRGEGHEGFFYGFWGLLLPTGAAIASIIVGFILSSIGFEPGVEQTGDTLLGLFYMFIILPAVFFILAAITFVWYPITRDAYADVRRQLEERGMSADGPGGQLS